MRPFLQILLLVWPAVATAQLTGIEGRVVIEGDFAPLQGATVAWSEGTKLRALLTNELGTFSVPPSASIPVRLAVSKAGFVTRTETLSANRAAIEIRLQRAAVASGVVRDAEGAPVFNATVRLRQVTAGSDGPSWTASTDDRGEFWTDLPPGQYRVDTIERLMLDGIGFALQALSDAVTVDLRSGERTRIALTHRRAAEPARTSDRAAITGVVLDAAGEPAAGITVRVFRGKKRGAFRDLVPVSLARSTDTEGRYRVFDLEPGKYVVQASDERPFIRALGANVDVPIYYPSAVAAPDALQLRVAGGQETGGIDILLRHESYVKVSGAVVSTGGVAGQRVTLTRRGPAGAFLEPTLAARVTAGAFEFPKVVPGEYMIQTDYQVPDRSPFVIVAASDLEGVVVPTIPPRRITGRVALEHQDASRSQFSLAFLSVDAETTDDASATVRGMVLVADDWTFDVTSAFGMGRFVLRKAPPGWFVRTVRDVSARPGYEPIDPDDGADLTIVLARATGVIEGTVRGSGTPGRARHVLAFSTDERLWYDRSPYVLAVQADDAGRFVMPPVPAGEYYVVAVDAADLDVPAGELQEPQLLRALTHDAFRVSVRDDARQPVSISVSSAR